MAVFDPSIFTRGAAMQTANQNRMFDMLTGAVQDYQNRQLLKEEKLKQQKAQALKPENIIAAKMQGLPTTPEQDATLEAYNVMQMSKMAQNPVTGELYSPYGDITKIIQRRQQPSSPMADMLFQQPDMGYPNQAPAPTPQMGGMEFPDVAGDGAYNVADLPPMDGQMVDPTMYQESMQSSIPMPDTSGMNPKAAQAATEATVKGNVDLEKEKRMADFKARKEERKAEKGRNQIDVVLGDFKKDYEALRELNAIRETGKPLSDNIKNYLATTGIGSEVGQATGSQAEAIRERIRTSKPKLMGAMKDALGLTGTELNSQQELQFYLNALTDPSQDFETNMINIQRLSRDWGGGEFVPNQQPSQPMQNRQADPLGLFE